MMYIKVILTLQMVFGYLMQRTLYNASYYVINSEFKVYLCVNNGANPERPNGQKSLYEPNFVATSVSQAGAIDDGYRWKYLYTLTPSEIIKFTTESLYASSTKLGIRRKCNY